jgi:hypothetical protein
VHFVSRQMKYLRTKFPNADKKELWKTLNTHNEAGKAEAHVAYLPDDLRGSVQVALNANPFQFLQCMFEMSQFLETQDVKTFALLPLRHGFVPRSIRIDTRDFTKLVRQKGLKMPKKKKRVVLTPTDDDIFISYKQHKVQKRVQT